MVLWIKHQTFTQNTGVQVLYEAKSHADSSSFDLNNFLLLDSCGSLVG